MKTFEKQFIELNQDRLSSDEKRVAASTGVQVVDSDLTIRKEITSATSVLKVLDSNTKVLAGISDFDGKKIPSSFMAKGISVAAGKIATGSFTNVAGIAYSNKVADIPTALLNGKLVVSQGGKVIFRKNVNDLVCEGAASSVRGAAVLELSQPQIITAGAEIDITIEFADGQAVADNTTNRTAMEIKFHGVEVIS